MTTRQVLLGLYALATAILVRTQSDQNHAKTHVARHAQHITQTPDTPISPDTVIWNMDQSLSSTLSEFKALEKKAIRINRARSRLPQYAALLAHNQDTSQSVQYTLASSLPGDSLPNRELTQNPQDSLASNAPRDSLVNGGPSQNVQDTVSAMPAPEQPLTNPPLATLFEMDNAKASHIFSGKYDDDVQEVVSYKQRRGDLNRIIDDCRKHPTKYNGRMVAWVQLIDKIKPIKNPELKLMLVNGFFNTMINYDVPKGDIENVTNINWIQTPQKTLKSGKGVCCDIAALKYETLMRVGFSPSQLHLIGILVEDKKTGKISRHMAPMVDYKNKQLILNSQQSSDKTFNEIRSYHDFNSQEADWNFIENSLIETAPMAFSYRGKQSVLKDASTYSPFLSFNEKPNASYYLAAFNTLPQRSINDELKTDEIAYLKELNSFLKSEHHYTKLLASISSLAYENKAFDQQYVRPTTTYDTKRIARFTK